MRPFFVNRRIIIPLKRLRYKLFGPMPRIGYMCMVDFDHELGEAMCGTKIYPSLEDLRRERSCVDECGIVKVKITRTSVVQPSNF